MKQFLKTNIISAGIVIAATLFVLPTAFAANVVARPTATAPAPQRASAAASRMPTLSMQALSASNAVATTDTAATTTTDTTTTTTDTTDDAYTIEDKSSQFDSMLSTSSVAATDRAGASLADRIREQRAILDAQSATTTAATMAVAGTCDTSLRDCMKQKCGNDYQKCAGDGDTVWGDKMDACRRDTKCTGTEYAKYAPEIKADRDMNAKLASFNAVLDCGNSYNDCIATECGTNYAKCLGKTAGDAAIAKCATIAKNCTTSDSGLASRTMSVFGDLRVAAEKQIAADEQRLYAMRDELRNICSRLGATLDERSMVCVYTVNFIAGDSATPYASKKLYSGSSFNCTQDWFGVDVTTFKENAFRLTREQTSASSAMLGAGLGTAIGAVTSGAINRAMDRQKAQKALKTATKECVENGYDAQTCGVTDEEYEDIWEEINEEKEKKEEEKEIEQVDNSDNPSTGGGSAENTRPETNVATETDKQQPASDDQSETETTNNASTGDDAESS